MTAYSIFCASSQFIAIHWGTLNGSLLFTTQKGFLPSPLKWLRLCWLDKLVSGTCISWPYSIPELFSYSGIINRLSKTHFFLIFRNIWAFLNAKGRHLLSAWELPPNTLTWGWGGVVIIDLKTVALCTDDISEMLSIYALCLPKILPDVAIAMIKIPRRH